MKITIIGAGNMGRGIGTRAVAGGHDVQIVDRDPEEAKALAQELGGSAKGNGPDDPIEGDVVVFAIYYPQDQAISQYADQLGGKVVVDISNPVNVETWDELATPVGSSSAEEMAAKLSGSRVVKAFNTTFSGTLEKGEVGGQKLDVFIAGDDDGAKQQVRELAESGDLNVVDAGPLKRAQQLEQAGFLHMKVQDALGSGYGSALKIVT
jgi:predicted dinucleotide-binding enzyme